MIRFLIVSLFYLFSQLALSKETKTEITLAADDWCPFTCLADNKTGPGVIPEIVEKALENSQFKMKYTVINWARALEMAKKNEIQGVLGAYKSDIPDFIFPEKKQATSKNCFFGLEKNKFKYDSLSNLKNKKIGIINSYGYGTAVDEFKVTKEGQLIFLEASGEDPLLQNLKKVEASYLDALFEDEFVIKYKKIHEVPYQKLTQYSCLEEKEVYAAFNPIDLNKSKNLAKLITDFMNSKKGKTQTKQILKKYLEN